MAEPTNSELMTAITDLHAGMMRGFQGVDERFAGVDGRFNGVEGRLMNVELRLTSVEGELRAVRAWTERSDERFASLERKFG